MNFLADECCDAPLVEVLRAQGHDVLYAVESMEGAPDQAVLERAMAERRILVTEDKDFGELVFRLRRPAFGLVLLRFSPLEQALKIDRMKALIQTMPERLAGTFVVLEPDRSRFRPLS